MKKNIGFSLCLLICMSIMCSCGESKSKDPTSKEIDKAGTPPVLFTVIGDVPYNEEQRSDLISFINERNAESKSEFLIHVGDIKAGKTPCDEDIYEDVSTILKEVSIPTFIILGDNEYNDCDNPIQGLKFWNQYFLHLNKNWEFEHQIAYQEERDENFSWSQNEVLFIGINLVGSQVHDAEEWEKRLLDNGKWTQQLLEAHKTDTKAAVIFAHANIVEGGPEKFETFTKRFRKASAAYGRPILFVHGDGHAWIQNRPWEEKNILRVQVDSGAEAVQVSINTALGDPFEFNRNFLK